MKLFETVAECSPVEEFIWNHISFDYGCGFAGVKQMSDDDLRMLVILCQNQLNRVRG